MFSRQCACLLLYRAVNIFKDCVPRQQTTQEDTYLLSKLSDQLFQESHWALLSIFVYKQLDKGFMVCLLTLYFFLQFTLIVFIPRGGGIPKHPC